MKKYNLGFGIFLFFVITFTAANVTGQRLKPAAKAPRSVIFAVLGNGTQLEPIAFVAKGKLSAPVSGGGAPSLITVFNKTYYKPGTSYRLIFGGADTGSVTVKSSDAKSDCAKNIASVTSKTSGTPLKDQIMALATNLAADPSAISSRRKRTAGEEAEMAALARAEFVKEKLTPRDLHFQNLTPVDVDNDGRAEYVASYWTEIDPTTRGLLFFIAGQNNNGKYAVRHSEYRLIDQSSLMGGASVETIDDGTLHELLLDVFDYDGDGRSEIFTYTRSFEGAGFTVYGVRGGKWTKVFEGSNYHCAF